MNRIAGVELSQIGFLQRLGDDVKGEGTLLNLGDRQTAAVDGDRFAKHVVRGKPRKHQSPPGRVIGDGEYLGEVMDDAGEHLRAVKLSVAVAGCQTSVG